MTFTWWRPASASKPPPTTETYPISQPCDADQLSEKLRLLLAEEPEADPLSQPCDANQLAEKLRLLKGHHHWTSSSTRKKRRESQQHRVKLRSVSASNEPRDGDKDGDHYSVRSSTYRHVPQEAASQFVRTTTVNPDNRLSYRLSRQASISRPDGLFAAQRGNVSQYNLRNTSFLITDPSSSCLYGNHHPLDSRPRSMVQTMEPQTLNRRRSTGGILARSSFLHNGQPFDPSSSLAPVEEYQNHHHQTVDWTQSDESCIQSTTSAVSSYLVRKQELALLLRRRLRSFAARSKDRESALESIKERASSNTSRGGIFARFRR
ncbi:hypothetical protein CP533_5515 [Ophiocordyceps camponoti-saundersi (nom. inval.)]|nr:hypothetical protein CP533_5515 [Ophiocordyceps camponoti-saundersi (nom. inval.)]